MDLFDRVKTLCDQRGITVAEMERNSGLGERSTYNWKRTSPTTDKLQKVADYFDVSVDFLLGRDTGASVTDDDIKFALFGGDSEITNEQFEEVKRFAQFVKERNGNR